MTQVKKCLFVLVGLLIPLMVFGQPDNEMKKSPMMSPGYVYVSPEGKIYVRSGTPLYLRLATSPNDNSESYLLRSQASKDPSMEPEPFQFEGHGRHTLRHEADHRIPQKNLDRHLFYVHDDGKAPRTKVTVTKAPWVYNGNTNIYGKPVDITIEFSDADSGVYSGYYSLNTLSFMPYSNMLSLRDEMDYKLQYYALDNVGNKSRLRTRYYSLDFTPPETTHKVIGNYVLVSGEDILSPRSRIALKAKDYKAGVKQIRYRFKGKRGVYDKKALTMDGLKDGTHELVYAAEDRVKNEEMNHTFSFYLDSVPPTTSDRLVGDQFQSAKNLYVSGRTQVVMLASDDKAGLRRIRYALNGGEKITYETPFNFPQKNGPVTYEYRASDLVRNVSARVVRKVVVDISVPDVKPTFDGEHYFSRETHYIRQTTRISLSAADNLSGVQSFTYALDMEPEITDGEPFTIEEEGEHSLKYRASDNVNNETQDASLKLYVDEKAPEIYHHFGVNASIEGAQVYPQKTLLYLAATDKQAGIRNIYYSTNDGKETLFKNPLSFNESGLYTVAVRAIDNVGNISSSDISFIIR